MSRNPERDAREEVRRRKKVEEVAFRMFAERGIEAVTLQEIADAGDIGIATVYKYYINKVNLVIAVSTRMWSAWWADVQKNNPGESAAAIDRLIFYIDETIKLYQENPSMLRFSGNFKNYIHHESVSPEQIKPHFDALAPMDADMRDINVKAFTDHTIRTDIPPQEMLTTTIYSMLAVAERYALGLVYADNQATDHSKELYHMKEMLLAWCRG